MIISNRTDWFRKFFLVFITLSFFGCGSPDMDEAQMLQAASDYYHKREFRAAIIEQINPDHPGARFELGRINMIVGDYPTAEKEFNYALKAGFDEGQVTVRLAEIMLRMRSFKRMIDELDVKETYVQEGQADLLGIRAMAYIGMNQPEEARKALDDGAKVKSDAKWLLLARSQMLSADTGDKNAIGIMRQAQELYPGDRDVWLMSVFSAMQQSNSDGVELAVEKILALEPLKMVTIYGVQAQTMQARFYIVGKDFAQAQPVIERLLAINPDNPEVNHLAGLMAFEKRQFDVAEDHALKVIQVAPLSMPGMLLYGSVLYAKKNFGQAAYYLTKYVAAFPGHLASRKLLGRTYMAMGANDDALTVLKAGVVQDADPELMALIGLSELRGGDRLLGIRDLKKAVEAAPGNLQLRLTLVKAYLSNSETEAALQLLKDLSGTPELESQAQRLMVLAYMQEGNIDQASHLAKNFLEENPEDDLAMALLANVYLAAGDRQQAREYFERALGVNPTSLSVVMSLARLAEVDGRVEDASKGYKKILDRAPDTIPALMALARLSSRQGKDDEAGEWLQKTREASPGSLLPEVMLADHYLRQGQLDKMETIVIQLVEKHPEHPAVLGLQGKMYVAQRNFEQALPPLRALVKRAPDSPVSHALYGEALLLLSRIEEARRALEKARMKNREYLPAWVLLVKVELQASRIEEAGRIVDKMKLLFPGQLVVDEMAGEILMSQGRYDEAARIYKSVIERDASRKPAAMNYYLANKQAGDDDAYKILDKWLLEHPQDAGVRLILAGEYLQNKMKEKAMSQYEEVVNLQGDNVVALNNLAWLYDQAGDARAIQMAEKAYMTKPANAAIVDTYAWLLVRQGNVSQGLKLLRTAFQSMPDNHDVGYHLAYALSKSGEHAESQSILVRLIDSGVEFEGLVDAKRLLETGKSQ